MGIGDLSLVTKTLINLLTWCFSTSKENRVANVSFSSQRPDQLRGNAVGLYLYHITEDPHYKNLAATDNLSAPVRYTPMGLILYYQLIAQYLSEPESQDSAVFEQNMMGIAMKAFHDYPLLDEGTTVLRRINETTVTDATVFEEAMKGTGTCLRIELLNIDQKDAMGYWATSHAAPRLAAYYKVSVVVLKPETPVKRTGRVLSYGITTFTGSAPRIEGCSNLISFTLPGKTEINSVDLSPAQVPVGNEMVFRGSGFSGDRKTLMVRNVKMEESCPLGASWEQRITENEASVKVQESLITEGGEEVPVTPGLYLACMKITKTMVAGDGSNHEIVQFSNESPYMITPRIDNAVDNIFKVPTDTDKTITVNGYLFPEEAGKEPIFPALSVYVGNVRLTGIKKNQALNPGEFRIPDSNTLQLLMPEITDPGFRYLPLRIVVNGAESPPNWIKVN